MKVYDVINVWQELDVLDIRFHTLDEIVDKFIVCEGEYTHNRLPSGMPFKRNWDRFRKFWDKIIYLNITKEEVDASDTGGHRFVETFHRGYPKAVLQSFCKDEDVVIFTDSDEIINMSIFKHFIDCRKDMVAITNNIYMYKLNWFHRRKTQGVLARWGRLKQYKEFNQARDDAFKGRIPYKIGLGWHFSAIGDREQVVKKFNNFCHKNMFEKHGWLNDENIDRIFKERKHVNGDQLTVVPISNMPEYVQNNVKKFSHILEV